jgi:hypothetical protein
MRIRGWKGKLVALKRVCDITGTDRDVEICNVTIAGQSIKLDLSPAGVDKLREFFGSVVIVRHPLADSNSNEPASVDAAADGESAETEDEDEVETEEAQDVDSVSREIDSAPHAAPERPVRRGRRPASVVKGARKKAAARRAAKPAPQAAQATAEIREWARANGFEVGERGAIPGRIRSAYTLAHE